MINPARLFTAVSFVGLLLANVAAAAPSFPPITVPDRTEADCFPLLDGPGPLERLALGGIAEAAVETSARCVSPHARYYLLRDADVVVFLDAEGLVRTSHALTRDRHRANIAKENTSITAVKQHLKALRAPELAEPQARIAVRKDRSALRHQRRWDRRWMVWHRGLARIARITGRRDQ